MNIEKEQCEKALDKIRCFDDIRLKDLFTPDNNIKNELDLIEELINEHFDNKTLRKVEEINNG